MDSDVRKFIDLTEPAYLDSRTFVSALGHHKHKGRTNQGRPMSCLAYLPVGIPGLDRRFNRRGTSGKITDVHTPKLAMSNRWRMSEKLGGRIDEAKL
jgi:hypothetical protein